MCLPRPKPPLAVAVAALLAAGCSSSSKPASPLLHVPSPAWEDQVVYFILTDRFSDGDPKNDDQHAGEFDPTDNNKYSGGDLQGVIDRLDYVQGLGATAIWITPPVANMWWDPLQKSGGYHGYWARDLTKIDEHQGTVETYQALSSALHRRGMYLIQDIVPNHMGNFFTYSSYDPIDPTKGFVKNTGAVPTSKPTQPPFDQDDATDPAQFQAAIYHWTPTITDYNDPNQQVNYQVSDLDDLNTENPVVRAALKQSYARWIEDVGVDAFRVDTVKYVPHDFWNDFFHSTDAAAPGILAAAKATGREDFFAFGEVFETPAEGDDAADRKVASYLGTPDKPELPAVLQFPLYEELKRVIAGGAPTADLTYRFGRMVDPALFPNPNRMPTFIDNHDVARFRSLGSPDALAQALAVVFTVPGIPVIYQGTEQDFTETRAAMFKGGFNATADHFDTTSAGYRRIQKLSAVRRDHPALRRGDLQVLYDSTGGAGALAYTRTYQGETVLVLVNTADQSVLVSGLATGLSEGTVLELLHAEHATAAPDVGAGGMMQTRLQPRAVVIARATSTVKPVTPPSATITVDTVIAGQTFTADVPVTGRIAPAGPTQLKMVLDGYVDGASNVAVRPDGTWSATVPVSLFPTGIGQHEVIFYDPASGAATPRARFTSDVTFAGQTYVFTDPVGDDAGPGSKYLYPQDQTFAHQMDITGVTVEVGVTTMNLKITMRDLTTVWGPSYGFDHVAFNVYLSFPGQPGATVLPSPPAQGTSKVSLNATAPSGFTWNVAQFSYGWGNAAYPPNPTAPDDFNVGAPVAAPKVAANAASKTVSFSYDRTQYGLASWSGVRIYIADWDFDGINNYFRRLTPTGGPWDFGGGSAIPVGGIESPDPKIMDDVPVISIP